MKKRVQDGTDLFCSLKLQTLLGDRLKEPDVLHTVPGRPSALARRSRIDVRGDHEQRHRLFVSLSDGRDDVGRAAARGNQADRRLLSSTRVAESHVSRAPFML